MHLSAWSEINAGSVIQTALRLPAVHRYAAVPSPFKEQGLRSGGVAFEETLQIAVREHLIPDQASGAPSFRSAWLACMKRPQRHSSVIPPGIMKSTTPGSAPAFSSLRTPPDTPPGAVAQFRGEVSGKPDPSHSPPR